MSQDVLKTFKEEKRLKRVWRTSVSTKIERNRKHFKYILVCSKYLHVFKKSEHVAQDVFKTSLCCPVFSHRNYVWFIIVSGFQCILSLSVNNFVMVIKTFIVAGTLLTQMFFYSYVGDYLQRQMEGIGHSVYSCSWYNISNHLSKNIVFIIQRSQYPVQLRAGNCFVVNMETYTSIIKTSMSYLSVLRVMVNT